MERLACMVVGGIVGGIGMTVAPVDGLTWHGFLGCVLIMWAGVITVGRRK